MKCSRNSVWLLLGCLITGRALAASVETVPPKWADAILEARQKLLAASSPEREKAAEAERLWFRFKEEFPREWDWLLQDGGPEFTQWFYQAQTLEREKAVTEKVIGELGESGMALRRELEKLAQTKNAPGGVFPALYARACEQRRNRRLQVVHEKAPRIIFTKQHTVRPSFFAYTEGQSDAQNERHFVPDSQLCLLEGAGLQGKVNSLVSDPTGAIRDPAISWDAQRVLFAWKKSSIDDDYHLYELDLQSSQVRQITAGLGFADYEPAWLPNGDIIFASTRCVQTVDCWWTEVSNLYTCDRDGRYLRRVTFDQVHSIYPQVLDDSRVIYTRWDYNDRGQIFPQPLFQMYADGTGQTEFYGNNSWFPTTIAHARGIPGTQTVVAILCGHHSAQVGKLAIIDPAKGRQENAGVQLVAPVRPTPAERIDSYGQDGDLWQYPFPLNETEFLVAYAPLGWSRPKEHSGDPDLGIYWMDVDGHRELLVSDAKLACTQPVPLVARARPLPWANRVDYRQTFGTFYVQDVYTGIGLAGVPRGTVKKLRVVALSFRPAGIGHNGSEGPGGAALISTPVAIGNGSWDVKTVLGETTVYEDGSALFTVPARTPVYFQALDERGYAVQTMRSWSTLQPGEFFACTGCHEHKNTAPPALNYGFSLAMKAGAQHLDSLIDSAHGFSFPKQVQPILDRHCVRCHRDRKPLEALSRNGVMLTVSAGLRPDGASGNGDQDELAFSLLGTPNLDRTAGRYWSDAYLVLTLARPVGGEADGALSGDCAGRVVNWIGSQSVPDPLPPRFAGATRSGLIGLLEAGHKDVKLSREEMDTIACWIDLLVPYCGDYREANAWSEDDLKKFEHYATKRLRMEEIEQDNIRDLVESKEPVKGRRLMRGMR
ncbi:MAG TPA: hypothetical protein VJA21_25435 [Verrucomicrobiae bacterium]